MGLSLYFLFCLLFSIAYLLTIAKVHSSWSSLKELQVPEDYKPCKKVSVIIAARNEEKNIQACVESIMQNTYPPDLWELIVIDDHSEDTTLDILSTLKHPNLKVLKQTDGLTGKKAALTKAINSAQSELILTTDADCVIRKKWIRTVAYAYETSSIEMATAPVVFAKGNNWIEKFQILDLAGMMAVTAHGIRSKSYFLGNGANMSFLKSTYDRLNGFQGNEQYASGDDMFLIHKLAQENPNAIAFLKTTAGTVTTQSESSFKDLKQQRKRWATKSKGYTDRGLQGLLVFIFLFNLLLVLNLMGSPFLGEIFFFIFLLMLAIKMVIDYLFLKNMCSYFDRREDMKSFFSSSFFAVVNILYSGWVSIFSSSYTWKGRKTN